MAEQSSRRLGQYRPLMVILIFTVVIWLAWAMSDTQSYPSQVKVEMVGVDTARFAIVTSDSLLQLNVTSNGYGAIGRYFKTKHRVVTIDMSECDVARNRVSIAVPSVIADVRSQLGLNPNVQITSPMDSLRMQLFPREKKGFVPRLRGVNFDFADSYGLHGNPQILTDTVWLYGSRQSLDKISEICTQPATIAGIGSTDTFVLKLDPVWKKYSDIRVSTESISVRIPTDIFGEQTLVIPVATDADSSVHIRLYPEKVRLTVLSPSEDSKHLMSGQFKCRINIKQGTDKAEVKVVEFPSTVRIIKIEPQTVQYVIIK